MRLQERGVGAGQAGMSGEKLSAKPTLVCVVLLCGNAAHRRQYRKAAVGAAAAVMAMQADQHAAWRERACKERRLHPYNPDEMQCHGGQPEWEASE
jgi:hypothetical protein